MHENLLKQAGLTGSECKIYLALLKYGTITKTPLVKHSKVPGSKIYETIDKLLDKGLVSVSIKNKVKHFTAAHPNKIKKYMQTKKQEIDSAEKDISKIIPELVNMSQSNNSETNISSFYGWKGLATAFEEEFEKHKPKTKVIVIGASSGKSKQTEIFYSKYSNIAIKKKFDIKIIFNKGEKKYVEEIEKKLGIKYEKKYLMEKSPTEVTVIGDTALIAILSESPIVIKIENKETANTFREYFSYLWKIAKK